jgi:hypothetical protein
MWFTLKSLILDDFLNESVEEGINKCADCGFEVPDHIALCWYCGKILSIDIIRLMKSQDS